MNKIEGIDKNSNEFLLMNQKLNIYPSNWKALLAQESSDYAYITAKDIYSLGYHAFKKDDISFTEFIEMLSKELDTNRFEIILWANTANSNHFSEIAILDKIAGIYHLVEYFEFDENDIHADFEQSQLSENRKVRTRHLIKHRFNIHEEYKKIEDDPVKRLRNVQNQLIGNLVNSIKKSSKIEFSLKNNNSLDQLWNEISKKKVKKYFIFGSLKNKNAEPFFITTDEEIKSFKDNEKYDMKDGSKSIFEHYNDRYQRINFIGNDQFKSFFKSLNNPKNFKLDNNFEEINPDQISKNFQHLFKKSFKQYESETRLKLSDKQKDLLIKPQTFSIKQKIKRNNIKFNLIEGAPGAGKTLMLARKAEEFLREEKKVLITHFTKTLKSYEEFNLESQTSGYYSRNEYNYPLCSTMHFHKLASNICELMKKPYRINSNIISNDGFVIRMNRGFDFGKYGVIPFPENLKYDLILIDEVQNFEFEWIQFLYNTVLADKGEMWVFYDREQTVYQKVKNSDFQKHLRDNSSKKRILTESYRLTDSNISILNKIKKFEKNESSVYEKGQIELFDYDRIEGEGVEVWFNFSDYKSNSGLIDVNQKMKRLANTVSQIISYDKINLEDCLILTDEHFHSSFLASELEKLDIESKTISPALEQYEGYDDVIAKGIKKEHFSHKLTDYEEDLSSEEKLKYEFFGIDNKEKNKVTLSTIHSSQGQEMSHVFVYLSRNARISSELLRVALTRASKNIYVFNDHFRWNRFKDHFENPLNKSRVEKIHSFLTDSSEHKYVDYEKVISANETI